MWLLVNNIHAKIWLPFVTAPCSRLQMTTSSKIGLNFDRWKILMDKNAEARKMFTENSSLLSFCFFSFSCFSTAARKQIVDLHRSKPLISLVLGQIFFLLFFVFSLTCYRVFFFFSLSGISLITLLCYVLYVNFVIVCYLAYLLPVLRVC